MNASLALQEPPKCQKKIHPADALKPIDQVLDADPRNKSIELADWHSRVANIVLIETTPIEVKQLFENAKNVALYSYFAYRLHQPAEAIGYIALEKALKLKFEQEKNSFIIERPPKALADYMNIALDQGWIRSEGYGSVRLLASSRVNQKKIAEIVESGAFEHQDSIPIPDPDEDEIIAEMQAMGIAERALHAGRHIRNALVHGDGGLSPSSIAALDKIAQDINQLFSAVVSGTANQNTTS